MSLRTRLALAAVLIACTTAAATASIIAFAFMNDAAGVARPMTPAAVALSASAAALVSAVPWVAAAFWFARSITKPLRAATAVAEAMASGVLAPPVAIGGTAEVAGVTTSIVALGHTLDRLISLVRAAAGRLANVAEDVSAALRHEETAMRALGGSASEITTAVAEISATSEQLLGATGQVMASAREAASVADNGREGLDRMAASIQHLDEAMNAFSRKLATISQRTAGITAVVTAIAKVADQTNLLSVNATIEAEKAGESGRGFRIVAQEIRRLADQTAQSTKDIERLVRDMQAAVAGGTMEMDRFRNEVSSRMNEVATVSEQLGQIIAPVQAVTRSLDVVHKGMASQSEGVRQIRAAMESLRGDAAESAASLQVFAAAVAAVREASGDLDAATARHCGQYPTYERAIAAWEEPGGPPGTVSDR